MVKNIKNKKTLFSLLILFFIIAIGATIAYFQSSVSFENLFTTGTYKVVTTETFESPSNWAPGEEIPKTITSTNEGTIPAAVRVSYTEQWLDEDNQDITSQVANGTAIINLDNTNEWTKEGNYYYYNYILEPEDTTSSFMKSVTLNPDLNGVTCTGDGNTKTCTSNNSILGGTYKLTITKETVQADRYQEVWNTNIEITEKTNAITYINRQVEGQITPGDVIGIGDTEDFYVVSSDSTKTVLLAKNSLLVGEWEGGTLTPETTPGYGLQSENAVGYTNGEPYATVYFSQTDYWDPDGNGLISPYNANGASYDGNPYPYVYDSNSEIYQYISGENGYVNRLIEMGAPTTITGRLLSYEEAIASQNIKYNGTSILDNGTSIFGSYHSYWLGSVPGRKAFSYLGADVWAVYRSDIYMSERTNTQNGECVRPVIEIPTSELQ